MSAFFWQVVSANGRCIGAKDIKVGNDKVSVQGLAVNLVTGLDIHLQAANNMPGTIIARTVLNQNFDTKYQVCPVWFHVDWL